MKTTTKMLRSTFGALSLVALLVGPLGCAGVVEEGENVGEAEQAIRFSHLSASPTSLNFGTMAIGTQRTLTVTLSDIGEIDACNITLAVPPDPYRTYHNPPTCIGSGLSSNLTEITFAPETAGTFADSVVISYRDYDPLAPGTLRSLTVPVTGTAY